MRLSRVTAFLIGFCSVLLLCGAAARGAEPTKSERELKAALAPHGDWLYVDGWGDVWSPQDAFFRPYARGHWTVDGGDWTYHGNSDWEELTAHYGHWVDDPLYGWLWRPDGVWKPSAVAWRLGRDYVGWAPLGPAGSVPKNPVDWVFVRGRIGRRNAVVAW